MTILQIEVVMRPKHIGGDNRGELAAMLHVIALVHHINHSLGEGVSKVAVVRRSVMHHGLIYGVCGLVGEDAG